MIESTISSPSPITRRRRRTTATRLIASVALRVKTISSARAGVEEAAHGLARLLVCLGRRVGEVMQAAMDVGVFVLVGLRHRRRSPPAASAPRRRCRDRPAACRRRSRQDREIPARRPRRRRGSLIVVQGVFTDALTRCLRQPAALTHAAFERAFATRLVARTQRRWRLVEERLDQQLLGLGSRHAARHQVEQLVVVECAAGGAVAADGRRRRRSPAPAWWRTAAFRQQQRLRHHLAVGLLRVRLDDDLALEDARGLAVDDGLEQLAAVASGAAWSTTSVVSACCVPRASWRRARRHWRARRRSVTKTCCRAKPAPAPPD